jgi:predicted PurR-regulated permease PerM
MKQLGDLMKTRSPMAVALIIAVAVGIGWMFYKTMVVWGYFIVAAGLAYLLAGPVNLLERRGVPRSISILIVFSIVCATAALSLLFLIPSLVTQINQFVDEFPKFISEAQVSLQRANNIIQASKLPDELKDMPGRAWTGFEEYSLNIMQSGLKWIIASISKLYAVIIIPLATFYLLKDAPDFKKRFVGFFASEKRAGIDGVITKIDIAFGGFIRSRLKLCLVVGVGMIVLLLVFRVPYAVVLGLFSGVCEFVPYVGPIVGVIPALVVGYISDKFLVVALISITVQALENAFFVPRIVGKDTGLHPLVVILALLAGSNLAGVGGMVLSVPVVAALKIMGEYYLEQTSPRVPVSATVQKTVVEGESDPAPQEDIKL